MMRRSAAIGFFALIVVFSGGSREAAAQDARAFIARLGNEAIQVLGPGVPPAQRQARFRELFHNDFDMAGIGQFVLGRYWNIATPQEQQEFMRLSRDRL
jgi:phospholipid transport system substrate-binding protein